ncbi:M23 family metallopeptidase [Streptomyces zagrosensis]|uniref:Murein DD-endopeptidase MepM/ murein hydrolase activator NlpD n=1 Tax=Streptomyces zagrosensis TaxID=1042984 RepID=A0A7W9V1L5_9ACTN|nr:M23 family metallopeptidase [Streptomyces zagrosensis]MBB5939423.1 murein DD-endopeptidase MepM/ murein hydrolase activator NlpD [Streptomyces zagrosensis]
MTQHTKATQSSKSVLRTRATVLAVGLGGSLALGTGVALAAAPQSDVFPVASAGSLEKSVQAQADAQQKAADAAKKGEKDGKKSGKDKKADHRGKGKHADRSKRGPLNAASWIAPVGDVPLSAPFAAGGARWAHGHSGQDFVVSVGTSVKAAHGGTVVKAGGNGGGDGPAYGNAIVIKHGGNTYSQYAHLSKVKVNVGETVRTGEQIGLSGNTGNSSGPHLHFEVRTGPNYGSGIEPMGFLRHHGVRF